MPSLQFVITDRMSLISPLNSNDRSIPLKVPSGQIGSAWEWYHWIGLWKDINRYMFLIFKFWSWIFEKSSKFWAASYKNESNLLLVGITVCLESFLPIGCRTFICWKIRQSSALFRFGLWIVGFLQIFYSPSRNPKNNCWSTVRRKRSRIPWSQQGGWLEAFLYEGAQNF